MTINKSTKDFMWSEAKPMKRMRRAEYRQSPHDAKFQHADYRKETPLGEIGFIKPQSRSGSGNTANLQGFQLQSKWALQAEYRQSLHDAEFQHFDYRKKTPRGEIGFINPQFRSGLGNTANFQEFQLQPISEKLKARVNGYRHSKLNT